jgi:hypothetical protein
VFLQFSKEAAPPAAKAAPTHRSRSTAEVDVAAVSAQLSFDDWKQSYTLPVETYFTGPALQQSCCALRLLPSLSVVAATEIRHAPSPKAWDIVVALQQLGDRSCRLTSVSLARAIRCTATLTIPRSEEDARRMSQDGSSFPRRCPFVARPVAGSELISLAAEGHTEPSPSDTDACSDGTEGGEKVRVKRLPPGIDVARFTTDASMLPDALFVPSEHGTASLPIWDYAVVAAQPEGYVMARPHKIFFGLHVKDLCEENGEGDSRRLVAIRVEAVVTVLSGLTARNKKAWEKQAVLVPYICNLVF